MEFLHRIHFWQKMEISSSALEGAPLPRGAPSRPTDVSSSSSTQNHKRHHEDNINDDVLFGKHDKTNK